ncbi:MAG: dTMP kinase [Polyangiaceae bacterium]|nr:dTMP kinase [Polyangiaceae bacterium]
MIEGMFFVVEGIDGAGTTTQVARLVERLTSKGLPAIGTREPTSGPIGALLRQALTHRLVVPGHHGPRPPGWGTMALLFAADRLDHLEATVLPNLQDGVSVISDRYDLSSLAYQSATASDPAAAVEWVRRLNHHARRPDLTVVIDVPAELAAQRRAARGAAEELYEGAELQRRLVEAYRRAEELVPGDRVAHVDGRAAPDEVADAVWAEVDRARRGG